MSDLTDLPEWVWCLLDALHDYEECHPLLYRMTDADTYERTECFGRYLSEHEAWPPRAVSDAAEFRRQVLDRAAERVTDLFRDRADRIEEGDCDE